MKKEDSDSCQVLSPAQKAELLALEGHVPDTDDIPEATCRELAQYAASIQSAKGADQHPLGCRCFGVAPPQA